jgi:hypothetical protein
MTDFGGNMTSGPAWTRTPLLIAIFSAGDSTAAARDERSRQHFDPLEASLNGTGQDAEAMKWISRAAGLAAVAVGGLAFVLATSCVPTAVLVILAPLSGFLLAVWLDEPARGTRRRVLGFLGAFYVGTLAILGVTLPLHATPGCG